MKISAVRVYFEGDLNNPTVTLTGGANAKSSGGLLTQSYLPGAMDTVTYTALTGAAFPAFENFTQNGVTVERTSDTVVTISGTPTANTEITVPDAESSSKIVTWGSSIINTIDGNGYSDTANGITLTKSGSGYASLYYGDWMTYGDVTLNFTTATGKFTSIEIEASQIYDGGNWTKDGNTLKWNGTPSNSVSLSGSSLYLEGVSSINFVIEMPTVSVTITPGSNMTKTTDSGDAEQTDLSGVMTDVVYTADNGYYFPTDYSVDAVNGISVTRNSYTQITVSGTPSADAEITLTAPTAKTTPGVPTAAATDCTTADNNDGKLTGVTTEMEYKKSDATEWTAGTGNDITDLVPGTYYVRVKATDTTNASTNQELTIKGFISYTVTFKVVNGKWNEGEGDAATADKTVTLTGHEGDTLKLTADQIPAVGTKPNDTYKAGSWDVMPNTDTAITEATTYTYTYAQKASISQTVTFKVVNGSWNDETTTDMTVTLTGYEGDTLKLTTAQIPAVGSKPSDTYKAGNWDVTPSTETAITEATTYTYTYAQKDSISRTVTFKVVNGSWNDETTTDKTVTLTGYEGDTLKLAADQIPTVGTKPNDTYKAGSWDVTPNTDTAITEATTYTYTYVAKEAAVVTKAPEGKTLTYNGQEQALVTAGEATGGEMQYALGDANGATQPYTTSIPAKTEAGTYYVWYKVKGDANHKDGEAAYLKVEIAKADITPTVSIEGWTYGDTAKAPSVTGNTGNGEVTYAYAVKGSTEFNKAVPIAAGDYTVRASIAATDHYNTAEAVADFTIAKKAVKVNGITVGNKPYDGNTTASLTTTDAVFDGMVEGDTLTVTATGTFEDANAGEGKKVTISGLTLGGAGVKNYELASAGNQTETTANITKKAVVVTPDADQNKVYGAADPAFTYTATGLAGEEELSGALARAAGEAAGEYAYTIGTLESENTNYSVSLAESAPKFEIKKAALTVTADPKNITYGDEDAALTYKVEGLTGSDKAEDVLTGTLAREAGTDAGTYKITQGSLTSADYGITFVGADYVIAKASQAAPAEPFTTAKATGSDTTDGKISGFAAAKAYQISSDNGTTWTDVTGKAELDVKAGTYQIRYAEDKNHEAGAPATVTVGSASKTAVTGVSVEPASVKFTEAGATKQIEATVAPEDADNRKVTWKSGDESVATVDENGLITAVANGTADITVTTDDGSKTATVQVTVEIPEPAAEAPVTEAPKTEEPKTEAPTTESPATEAPKTEALKTEEPKTETPTTEAPATEAPKTEAPTTQASKTEKPTTQAPKTEAPTTQATKTEKPTTEKPATTEKQSTTEKKTIKKTTTYKVKASEKAAAELSLNEGLKVDQTGSRIKVEWGKVKGADGYRIFVQYCGKKFRSKAAKTIKKGSITSASITKINGKKLNLKKNFKLYVAAYKKVKGQKVVLGKCITAHVVGRKNTSYTNVREIKVTNHTIINVYMGHPHTIEARTILVESGKKQLSDAHATEFRYASSNSKIATVDSNGVIRGVKEGKCTIYVYARNGYAKKIQVTVK